MMVEKLNQTKTYTVNGKSLDSDVKWRHKGESTLFPESNNLGQQDIEEGVSHVCLYRCGH